MHLAVPVLVGLLLVAGSAVPAAATLFGSVREICHDDPLQVASNVVTDSPDDPNPGTLHCAALCDKWVTMCKGAVNIARSCSSSALTKLVALRNAACNVNSDPTFKESCLDGVAGEKQLVKTFYDTSAANGKSYCEGSGRAGCMSNCN